MKDRLKIALGISIFYMLVFTAIGVRWPWIAVIGACAFSAGLILLLFFAGAYRLK